MDISEKKDWSGVYTHVTPVPYLKMVSEQEYQVPSYALNYLKPLVKKLYSELKRPINIVDIGASYGIISSLLLHDLRLEDLIDFFVEKENKTWDEIESFYAYQKVRHTEYRFYVADSSKPAMDFSEQVNLCEKSYCFDMKNEEIPEDFKQVVAQADLFIATGSLAYIGEYFFEQVFPIISAQKNSPLFAFVIYRAFYSNSIEKVFGDHEYTLLRSDFILKKGRRFASQSEQEKTLHYLGEQNVDTVGLEQEGYYAGEFHLGVPNFQKESLDHWLKEISSNMIEKVVIHEPA
ncbi:hypothetical protein [Roseofilum capinflatum]|uniref:Class I SAM-dependent methyltransferase n=1 Tax=Roseofilum capinflatum BLCC-M114 TaxID=3022440 RepID=A0ABT7B748_9CYAN|nr:hypothetical protein [Roseofilum capinflatum]MDJ1174454.1 hypothetical protein [Roseofilum capinflatum BLCC-M114]